MQKIKNVYVDVYCIKDGMVHIFFCLGAGDTQKNNSFCVHTKFLRGGGVEMGWECVDYHGVSKYNDGW